MKLFMPKLHEGQKEVREYAARFKVLACGRRWGKTYLGSLMAFEAAINGGLAWWVGPTYPSAQIGWQALKKLARYVPNAKVKKTDRMIVMPSGGNVQVRSAEAIDGLRGAGLNFVVVDEAAFIDEAAWTKALRPALSDKEGQALIISTPNGRNWFWRAWQRGMQPIEVSRFVEWPQDGLEWASFQYASKTNPHLKQKEIDKARDELPESIFKQEYLAEFLDTSGAVFRKVDESLNAPETRPEDHKKHHVVMGVDWGKYEDFTALSVGCSDCLTELEIDRFNRIDYVFQRERLKALAERWNVQYILAEQNAMGDPIIEELQRDDLPVEGFVMTQTTKKQVIEGMKLALEKREWRLLPDEVAKGEMEGYRSWRRGETGWLIYGAPEGMYDDTVIARALMVYAVTSAPRVLLGV